MLAVLTSMNDEGLWRSLRPCAGIYALNPTKCLLSSTRQLRRWSCHQETIIPAKYRAGHERGLRHFLATGEGPVLNQRVEMTALRRDGRRASRGIDGHAACGRPDYRLEPPGGSLLQR